MEPNERLVTTEIFEGAPENGAAPPLCTYTFTARDGRTTFTLLTQVADKATRDTIIDSGMETGMQDGYDLAEQIAVELAIRSDVAKGSEGSDPALRWCGGRRPSDS